MEAGQIITPGVVVAVGFAVWRLIHLDISKIGERIDRVNERIDRHIENHPRQATTGASPLRLTEFGEKLSEYMDAPNWAQEIAVRVPSSVKGDSNYRVQQYCFDYVRQRKYDPSPDFIRKMEDCAFNHATTVEEVERALAVVLRDEILSWRATEPADS